MSLGIRPTTLIAKHGDEHDEKDHGNWADGISTSSDSPSGLGISNPLGSGPTRTSIPTPEGMPEPPEVMFNPAGRWTDETFSWMLEINEAMEAAEEAGLPTEHIKEWRRQLWAEKDEVSQSLELPIYQAITRGDISPEEALEAGVRRPGWAPSEGDTWIDLPETAYHATTALSAVQAEGLKSRVELDMGEGGVGLGGGASDTISLTTDPAIAENINFHIQERWQVLNNPDRMVDLANEAFQSGWYLDAVKGGLADVTDPEIRQDLFDGLTKTYISPSQFGDYLPEGMTVSQAIKDPETMASMAAQYLETQDRFDASFTPEHISGPYWKAKRTEAGRMEALGDWMDSYVAYRSWNGGPDNPLFFATDDLAFSQLDASDFGVVELQAKPGAKGIRLNSLGEIRIFTGDAVEVVG